LDHTRRKDGSPGEQLACGKWTSPSGTLRGGFTFIRRSTVNPVKSNWKLIKQRDEYADAWWNIEIKI
jgi:hypothetical protein